MQRLSLLNSVIGPVMRGPSSSHAAGPYHIASAVRQLATGQGGELVDAVVRFDPAGSFAAVYTNQGSDEGFAAGLAGVPLTDLGYRDVLGRFERDELFPLRFEVSPIEPHDHPNRVLLDVTVRQPDGWLRTDSFSATSTGGGMFLIDALDGRRIDIDGSAWTVLVHGTREGLALAAAAHPSWPRTATGAQDLAQFVLTSCPTHAELARLQAVPGVEHVRLADPSQLSLAADRDVSPMPTASAWESEPDLAAAALALEADTLGLTIPAVRALFRDRCELMLGSVERGLQAGPEADAMTFLAPSAQTVSRAELPAIIGGRFLHDAMAGALAVMEQNTARGVVVAAPTAGSAGIVPGTLYALARAGVPESDLVESLAVMALVGGVFGSRATFAAELGGCAVETGASAAMAAGGVVHVAGGDATRVFRAASLCLMNTLGLVCDPVGGEVEIPCHARNIAGVAHVQSSAIATLAGFDAVMPFDHMVAATLDVGRAMHPDLRCTGRGGCAAAWTPPRRQPTMRGFDLQPVAGSR